MPHIFTILEKILNYLILILLTLELILIYLKIIGSVPARRTGYLPFATLQTDSQCKYRVTQCEKCQPEMVLS